MVDNSHRWPSRRTWYWDSLYTQSALEVCRRNSFINTIHGHTALENSKTAGLCSLALRKAKRFEEKPPETKTLGSYSATSSDLGSSEHSCGLVTKTDAETFLMKSSRQWWTVHLSTHWKEQRLLPVMLPFPNSKRYIKHFVGEKRVKYFFFFCEKTLWWLLF